MGERTSSAFGSLGRRPATIALLASLAMLNIGAWIAGVMLFHGQPLLLGTALLAYGFGLRHAVDADHIAAIDNATRRLMARGKRPIATGLFFSLGHSTVVLLASAGVAITAGLLETRFVLFQRIGGLIGTGVSVLFLFAIGIANLVVLASAYAAWRRRSGDEAAGSEAPPIKSPLMYLFGRLFDPVRSAWHLFPIGFLFGLGFDTATEIALLDLSAVAAAKGMALATIMIFPVLFTAGMVLVDTADGLLMIGAYGWALRAPGRRQFYNVGITLASALVALVIGGLEALNLVGDWLAFDGRFWRGVACLNDRFGSLGFGIILLFALMWLGAMIWARWRRSAASEIPAS